MPECIACKGEYHQEGLPCPRCGADTARWENWQRERPEEQGGLRGLLAFMEPHLYLPGVLTILAAAFGFLSLGSEAWKGLQPDTQILIVVLTLVGCPLAVQGTYESRHRVREQNHLVRVQSGWRARLGRPMARAILIPALTLLLVLLILIGILSSPLLRKLLCIFAFEEGYCKEPPPEGIRAKLEEARPLLLALSYLGFMVAFTYSSSLLLAIRYAREMDRDLPLPVFLDDDRLALMVRTAANRQLDRFQGIAVRVVGVTGVAGELDWQQRCSDHPLARNQALQQRARWGERYQYLGRWNWEETERTADGGIRMRAYAELEETEETATGLPAKRRTTVIYTVTADPWGRIRRIHREEKRATRG